MNDANHAPPASDAPAPPLETIARAAIEIVQECRDVLGLKKGETLTDAVRQLHEEVLVARGMDVAREVIEANRPAHPSRADLHRVAPLTASPDDPPHLTIAAASPAQEATPPELLDTGWACHPAAPTPEASAPEPEDRCAACGAPSSLSPHERITNIAAHVKELRAENRSLRATVAALTAERTRLQQQYAGGTTEKSEPPTAAAPNQPQEPNLKGESPVCVCPACSAQRGYPCCPKGLSHGPICICGASFRAAPPLTNWPWP